MTTPIKPPGGGVPKGIDGPAPSDASGKPEAFRKILERAEPSAPPNGKSVAEANALEALAAQVRAGKLEPTALIDQLVERAMKSAPAAALSSEGRAQLEATLRAALSDDPTLAALFGGATEAR